MVLGEQDGNILLSSSWDGAENIGMTEIVDLTCGKYEQSNGVSNIFDCFLQETERKRVVTKR